MGTAPKVVLALVLAAAVGVAQCQNEWLPGAGASGVALYGETGPMVRASALWDPDGGGPAGPLVVIGGFFNVAADQVVNSLATYDAQTGQWATLGSGTTGGNGIWALLAHSSGDLYAAGHFSAIDGVPCAGIARFDGAAWHPLGTGLGTIPGSMGRGYALAELPGGDVAVGGFFTSAGGQPASRVARWDGSSWSAFGAGLPGVVGALFVMPGGELHASGLFTIAPTQRHVARWDGATWTALGNLDAPPTSMAVLPNGNLVVAGSFTTNGLVSLPGIAQWTGSTTGWAPVGSIPCEPTPVVTLANGLVLAGAACTTDGTSWNPYGVGAPPTDVETVVELPGGELVAAGGFREVGGRSALHVARLRATGWEPAHLGGLDEHVYAVEVLGNGDLIVGGRFVGAGTQRLNRIARRSGGVWLPLGGGIDGLVVFAVAELQGGDILAGGTFTAAGGVPVNRIARWNGAVWSAMGDPGAFVHSIQPMPDGSVVAGLRSNGLNSGVRRWDGVQWTDLGFVDRSVWALTLTPGGELVAGGAFQAAGGVAASGIAVWDGSTWSPLGTGTSGDVQDLAVLPGGDLVAVGSFAVAGGVTVNGVARWDGAMWHAFGAGFGTVTSTSTGARCVGVLPDGDLLVGGRSETLGAVARWDGNAWSSLGDVTERHWVSDLVVSPRGEVLAVGTFLTMAGAVSMYAADLSTTCPAAAVGYGPTCTGPTGTIALAADTLPWIGSTFRATATGLAPGAVHFRLFGFGNPAVPLAAISPLGVPGCELLSSQESVELLFGSSGAAPVQLPIPVVPAFVGVALNAQVVQMDLDAGGAVASIVSTNGLALTVGAF